MLDESLSFNFKGTFVLTWIRASFVCMLVGSSKRLHLFKNYYDQVKKLSIYLFKMAINVAIGLNIYRFLKGAF